MSTALWLELAGAAIGGRNVHGLRHVAEAHDFADVRALQVAE